MELVVEISKLEDIKKYSEMGIKNVEIFVDFFSARSLNTFESSELNNLKNECLKYNMQLFIDVKRMFVDEEMEALKTFLIILDEIDIDGIYYSDLSVYMLARELKMESKLIYQPETLLTNNYDAAMYLKLGLKAVCIAKELTLDEISEIAMFNKDQIEVFIHGHALMSFSKRPLLTNYFHEIGHKEEMKPYYLLKEEQREGLIPVMENEQGTHFFSDEALMSFNEIKTLRDSHVLYGHISRIFLSDEEYDEAISLYLKALSDEEVDSEAYKNKYKDSFYSSGFYYKKTSVKKEY